MTPKLGTPRNYVTQDNTRVLRTENASSLTRARTLSRTRARLPTQEALVKALALNGTDVDGRVLSVERALPRGARPAKGAAAKTTAETTDATQQAAAAVAGGGGNGGVGGGVGDGEGGQEGDAEGASAKKKNKKKNKKKKAEGEVVVFGAGTGGGGGGSGGGGGIKWPVHPTTVFVRGLGMSATSADLRSAFVGVGAVVEARVVEDKKTRETKVGQAGERFRDAFLQSLLLGQYRR